MTPPRTEIPIMAEVGNPYSFEVGEAVGEKESE